MTISTTGVLTDVATAIAALLSVALAVWGGRKVIGLFR